MNGILGLLALLGPQLWRYFTKNKGLNTATGGLVGGLLAITLQGFLQNEGSIDGAITWLQNQGEYGLIAGAAVAGLRTAVYVWQASRKKSPQ